MPGNPNIPQGTLNRVRASFICMDFPALNVTAAFLGRAGITLAFEGEATNFIGTMGGVVTSPQPYQMVTATLNLLKSQILANQWEAQRVDTSLIGDCKIKGDSPTLVDFYLNNCAIETIRELSFAGEDAGYVVTVKGYYIVNNAMWNIV